ncbi:hypothetical protein [Pandoraea sp. NPDC090278]|uniref:T6SS effector phospholipase Tle3 domain-containing protein n=1 Tax=Pandoraea sp. NPDC090278 TaxID=3364391 RepID=UPI00383AA356
MTENTKSTDKDAPPKAGKKKPRKMYQHPFATRIVPMQVDHLGQPFWKSYLTPCSYEVRAEARIPPHLPGIVIFVHGVNSEGEWYDKAERALCDGLNERLNLPEEWWLQPTVYTTFDANTKKATPRQIAHGKLGRSPVIRFYWGYRAPDGTEQKWRIPMRNRDGVNQWGRACWNDKALGPWYWGGGPFQNGTNNLLQMWSPEGFKRRVLGFDLENINTESDRQLDDAPPRLYFAHAAQRLADLIDRIRTECPRDTISVMSHSQGTMVAMAATLLVKTRAPDALFVMNSPYALEDKVEDLLTCGTERQSTSARVNTFRNVVKRIQQDRRPMGEAEMVRLHCGTSEDWNFWRPDNQHESGVPERDNHGRLYVYFSPHDRVMGASPLQSIGWQGVSDKLLMELGSTVKQRMLARGTPVGDSPGIKRFGTLPPIQKPVPGVESWSFWNGNRKALGKLLWTVPDVNKTVTINAETVLQPLTAEEMRNFDDSRVTAPEMGQMEEDPIQPGSMKYVDDAYPYFRPLYEPKKEQKYDPRYRGVVVDYKNEAEALQERDNYRAEPTNHSTVPGDQKFMRRVVAYDLPIGFCDAYKRRDFWLRLIKQADWTLGYDPYFQTGVMAPVPRPAAIDKANSEKNDEAIQALKAYLGRQADYKGKDVVYGD